MQIKFDLDERYVKWLDAEKKRIAARSRAEVMRRVIDVCDQFDSDYRKVTSGVQDDGSRKT